MNEPHTPKMDDDLLEKANRVTEGPWSPVLHLSEKDREISELRERIDGSHFSDFEYLEAPMNSTESILLNDAEPMPLVPDPTPGGWTWEVFGADFITIPPMLKPPLWRRILTRIFLGSHWIRH